MDSPSNCDESFDLGYEASASSMDPTDHSAAETPISSTLSSNCFGYFGNSSAASAFSDTTDENSGCSGDPSPSHWSAKKSVTPRKAYLSRLLGIKEHRDVIDDKIDDLEVLEAELEMMKERLSKLLLGEDMSGSGKGVCTAAAISNSITNLYATVFGQSLSLDPLKPEKKAMWKREMESLLSVCDHIVELTPKFHTLRDGTTIKVMETKPRLDIYINLPALRKLDTMLLEILDSFHDKEFWYAEQGCVSANSPQSSSSQNMAFQRTENKWWVPVPCVPPGGLSEKSRKHLQHKRDCCNQIHKAAMAINSTILSELEIPETYMASLPKTGKGSVGDTIYRYLSSAEEFSPKHLLDILNIASEHEALQLADRVEASMYIWRRKATSSDRSNRNHVLGERAESLLFRLKQKYPCLSQTSLDACKIQYNTDVGQAILESYSRVLEGLAFNMVSWIEDVLCVNTAIKSQKSNHQSTSNNAPIL